ncbi:uncharacterized protein LOC136032668 [Artemia franciscana]|uniref:uncharacterized protein LOC136032668 n=1 Tax=Artemia franciscana TaxID=6661 RepID=UPI0032DB5151
MEDENSANLHLRKLELNQRNATDLYNSLGERTHDITVALSDHECIASSQQLLLDELSWLKTVKEKVMTIQSDIGICKKYQEELLGTLCYVGEKISSLAKLKKEMKGVSYSPFTIKDGEGSSAAQELDAQEHAEKSSVQSSASLELDPITLAVLQKGVSTLRISGSSDGPSIESPVDVIQDAKVKTKILPTRPHRNKKSGEAIRPIRPNAPASPSLPVLSSTTAAFLASYDDRMHTPEEPEMTHFLLKCSSGKKEPDFDTPPAPSLSNATLRLLGKKY